MHLRFVDHRLKDQPVLRDHINFEGGRVLRLPDGCPVLLDDRFRPVEPWLTYFRVVSASTKKSSVRNYAYDARMLASFLQSRGTDIVHASQEDIVAYRDFRLCGTARPVSPATWQRNTVVIKGIYSLLKQQGVLTREPWISVGSSTPLRTGWTMEPDIKPLSRKQWLHFRDVGLAGKLPNGSIDPSWRGRNPQRSVAAAHVAVTSGMRLAEFSSLLDVEVPPPSADGTGASVLLGACAKYEKRRRVHLPPDTLGVVDLYRQTERRRVARAASAGLWKRRKDLLIVTEVDSFNSVVRGSLAGRRKTWRLHRFPPELRRIAVREKDQGLEALGLFIGHNGLPIGSRSWHTIFAAANQRAQHLVESGAPAPLVSAVNPHDLRHTFAVVLLKSLTDLALAREADRRAGLIGPGSLSEHISVNPRLTVQRLLGHSSPETTMTYLRYIEDTDEMIHQVFESWADETLDYSDYIAAQRTNA
jgi:integrase